MRSKKMGIVRESDFRIPIAEVDAYMWIRNNNLCPSHRLSIRKKDEKFEVYRNFDGKNKSEQIIFTGKLECAVAVANSQVRTFHNNLDGGFIDWNKFEYSNS